MIKERAMELAEALESGEYEQAVGALKTRDGYCCLGVACLLAGEEFSHDDAGFFILCEKGERVTGVLTPKAQDYFGFESFNGASDWNKPLGISRGSALAARPPGSRICTLIGLNDGGYTFKEIAAIIRERWEDL